MQDLLEGLNSEQRRAVITTEGPLLILAGAGSGKTKTLTHRIAYILSKGMADFNEILAVTFTNKAAKEMRERTARLTGNIPNSRYFMPFVGTFHSICVKILRESGEYSGIPSNFVIYDEADKQTAIKKIIKQIHVVEKNFPARTISAIISNAKNELITPEEFKIQANSQKQEVAAKVFPLYQALLKESGALDFDDLIAKTVSLLQNNKMVRQRWQNQFKYIMIDEYQDTNNAQYKLIKLLTAEHNNLAVVGDDWQCLLPKSNIQTTNGSYKIKDISKGMLVKASSGYGDSNYFPVTNVRKFKFSGEVIEIITQQNHKLSVTPNHIMFARWGHIDSYFVYLMYSPKYGYRIGMTKGTRFDGKKNDTGLRVRANQERATKMWVIEVCSSREEAKANEALYSYKYGIPMMVFRADLNRRMSFSQAQIDNIYAQIDTRARAAELFADLGISQEYPHFIPGASLRGGHGRAVINVVLFGDKRKTANSNWSASRLSVNTSDRDRLKVFESLGYTIRAGRANTYRTEVHNLDYGKIESLLDEVNLHGSEDEVITKKYSYQTQHKFDFLPASQLHVGMLLPVADGDQVTEDKIKEIKRVNYDGDVYDLDIQAVHNYAANSIIVHNSIYSWRGADYNKILNFKNDHKDTVEIKLEQNYRSTKLILDAAHAVITKNTNRSDKKLWTDSAEGSPVRIEPVANERVEGEFITRNIKSAVDLGAREYSDFAVLYRTNAQSRSIEEAMIQYGVPYRIVGGTRFYDRREIKDIMAYLRLIYQPEDQASFDRIVNVPKRAVGKKSLQDFNLWRKKNDLSLMEAMTSVSDCDVITPKARAGITQIADIILSLGKILSDAPVAGIIDSLVRRIDYYDYLDDGTIQGESKIENVKELLSVAEQYQDLGLEGFLEEVGLVSDLDQVDLNGNTVALMTLHSAKGLEFPVVFMVGMEESIFPHARGGMIPDPSDLEEERRLCYVGMTRAREELFMIYARMRMLYGKVQYNQPSMFLKEVDSEFNIKNSFLQNQKSTFEDNDFYDDAPAESSKYDDEPYYIPELYEGDAIKHEVFGIGTVLSINDDVMMVNFKNKGIKKLILAFAKVEKL